MKKIISILCLLMSFGATNNLYSQSSPDSLIGGWKFQKKTGGITGSMISSSDHDFILFSSDCKFQSFSDSKLKLSSNYNLWKSKTIYGDSLYHISVDNDYIEGRSFRINNNRLFIMDEYHDGFTTVYLRKYTKEEIDRYFKKAISR